MKRRADVAVLAVLAVLVGGGSVPAQPMSAIKIGLLMPGTGPFTVNAPDGGDYRVKLVASDPVAYDRFYNIIANPLLWFVQHYLWDLSNAPDIRRNVPQLGHPADIPFPPR